MYPKSFNLLFQTPDSTPAPVGKTETTEDILLAEEPEKPEIIELEEKKKEDKEKEKDEDEIKIKDDEEDEEKDENEEEEVDELKEIEEELEGPKEEDLELMIPVRRREILAKYPQLFKDFPYMERAMYRDQKYTEVFPTPRDAEEAKGSVETLEQFERDISDGNIEPVLEAVVKSDLNTFNKIIDNLLPTIQKLNGDAYHHIIGTIGQKVILSMYKEGQKTGSEEMQNAAVVMNQYLFGTSDVTPLGKLAKETPKDDKDKGPSKEQQFVQTQLRNTQIELKTRVDNTLKATIESNLDPKESMTPFVRKAATREVLEKATELLSKDKQLGIVISKLWDKVIESNFAKPEVDKIKSVILSRAKTVLPTLIKNARAEALKGSKIREPKEKDSSEPVKREAPSSSKGKDKEIPKGMSTLDFLNED